MENEAKSSYRDLLLKAKDNRWLWPSYIVASVLLILIPTIKGWGNFDTLSMMLMMIAIFGLCVLLASERQLYRFNVGTVVMFMLLAWFKSSPTEGFGTYFYTDTQIDRFKQAEEARLVALKAIKIRQEGTSYSQLNYSHLKAHLPENFKSEITIVEDNGNIKINMKDLPKDVADQVGMSLGSE
ncbi:hypothetical protein L1D14_07610 [Vibrio tubiashii]|uniref:hypothetical protein n=1 Tax=Vibrio tubiashii TaxID=29498 RepID=UPI001EFD3DDF|nr:hypothetical protein [Vibrio tubiashii]MCG9576105.1 hypothetical protein [Vibrio tubiashii]